MAPSSTGSTVSSSANSSSVPSPQAAVVFRAAAQWTAAASPSGPSKVEARETSGPDGGTRAAGAGTAPRRARGPPPGDPAAARDLQAHRVGHLGGERARLAGGLVHRHAHG